MKLLLDFVLKLSLAQFLRKVRKKLHHSITFHYAIRRLPLDRHRIRKMPTIISMYVGVEVCCLAAKKLLPANPSSKNLNALTPREPIYVFALKLVPRNNEN